jgi:hypothetical protein
MERRHVRLMIDDSWAMPLHLCGPERVQSFSVVIADSTEDVLEADQIGAPWSCG